MKSIVMEFGECPEDEVKAKHLAKVREIAHKFYEIAKSEHPALVASACLSITTNLTLQAGKENILITLDCIENMKNILEGAIS
jgi:hypothetical protein